MKDGMKAKARLVVLGFEDLDIGETPSNAPLTKDGRQMVLSSRKWELASFDISTTFLRGHSDGRLLGLQRSWQMQSRRMKIASAN